VLGWLNGLAWREGGDSVGGVNRLALRDMVQRDGRPLVGTLGGSLSPTELASVIVAVGERGDERLLLSGEAVDAAMASGLAVGLSRCTALLELDISKNQLGPEGIKLLGPALTGLTALTQLNLSNNKFGDQVGSLCNSLAAIGQIISLNISSCGLGVEGGRSVARTLQQMTQVTHLDLSSNMLRLEGGQAIASSLVHLHLLSLLNLRDNNMGVDGYEAVVRCLRHHSHIQNFWLENFALEGHSNAVTCVALCPDGSKVASSSWDKTVKIWSTLTGEQIMTIKGHLAGVNSVDWSPDNTKIASASDDMTAKIWNALTGELIMTLEGHSNFVRSVVWSPDCTKLASTSKKEVFIWDAATGAKSMQFDEHSDWVESAAWNRDGTRLASASLDKTSVVWNSITGQVIATLKGHTHAVTGVAWMQKDDVKSPSDSNLRPGVGSSMLVTASGDKTLIIWDEQTGQKVNQLRGHEGELNAVVWKGDQIVSGADDNSVMLWDAASGQQVCKLKGHQARVFSVAVEGSRIVSASGDRTAIVWNAQIGE